MNIISKIMYGYIGAAKSHNIKFTLSYTKFKRLIFKNCYYCGEQPSKQINSIVYNGIDRKNPKRGYISKNTVPCCHLCKSMKTILSYDKFISQVEKIYG